MSTVETEIGAHQPAGRTPLQPSSTLPHSDVQRALEALAALVPSVGAAPDDAQYLVAAANGTLTAERVTTDTATVAWDHATVGQAKANVPNDAVTDDKLRDSTALSVVGRASNSVGNPGDIVAATDGHVLRRSGTSIGFGTILAAAISDFAAAVVALFRPLNVNGVAEPQLEIYADDASTQANITATTHGLNGGGTFHGRHSRGTRAAPTASQAGDITGGIGSRAYHSGGAFQTSSPAAWHWQATENQTGTAFGMWLRALTTPKGTTTRQERGGWTDVGTLWNHDTGTYDASNALQTLPVSDARFVASGDAAVGSAGASFVAVTYGGIGNSTPGFRGMGARGTPALPTAIQADNFICFLGGHGYGATGFSAGTKALIGLKAAENWTDAAQGTYVTIETTPVGGTTRVERMRINDAGTALILGNLDLSGFCDLAEIASPATPASGKVRFYAKTDNRIYIKDDAGTETAVIAVGADDSTVGVMDTATDAEIRSAAAGAHAITPADLESAAAAVALTDAATVAVDWDTGINFSLTVTANRVIGNPTNGQPGTWRTILVQGNDATDRVITFGNQYLGEVPVIADCDNGRWYLLMIMCISATHFVVSSKKANGT